MKYMFCCSSCQAGSWLCEGSSCISDPPCLESEFQCVGGRCIPAQWRCDNEDDCGDGSDELCPSTCAPGQLLCTSGRCLDRALWCDGHPDCADQSDEEFCAPVRPVPLCPPGEFQCASGLCLPASKLCDGRPDCGFADDSDERGGHLFTSRCPPLSVGSLGLRLPFYLITLPFQKYEYREELAGLNPQASRIISLLGPCVRFLTPQVGQGLPVLLRNVF